jgi:hypothetical protein
LARSGEPEIEIHWSADGECVAEVVHGEANARLIAACPAMWDYIILKAAEGDMEALKIMESVNASS